MEYINYLGIKTNNLKNIDIRLKKNTINCIVGPSGSGKSSLAYDTINAISEGEYKRLVEYNFQENKYDIDSYNNIIMTLPLRQLNYNVNPRSTIGTYFGMNKFVAHIYAHSNNVDISTFLFNNYKSMCKKCNGLGYDFAPDNYKIINFDEKIENNPFYCWENISKNYYRKLLIEVCNDYHIDYSLRFKDLSKEIQEFLLYGHSTKKYKINFTQNGRNRVKTSVYRGVINDLQERYKTNKNLSKYFDKVICEKCNGKRYNNKVSNYKVNSKDFGEVMLMDFVELYEYLIDVKGHIESVKIKNALDNLINFIKNINDFNLGYLNMNRSIESLSGGEFQRLKLSQIINLTFENMLIILDEPLASLHPKEVEYIIPKIINLKNRNTVLMIEHNQNIIEKCDNIIVLGTHGGENGGYLISSEKKYEQNKMKLKAKIFESNNSININLKGSELKDIGTIDIKLNTITGVCGVSGCGKTTFIKNILPRYIKDYKYISQKPIKGNVYSTIASYIGIMDEIRELFAFKYKKKKSFFSYYISSEGACKSCKGTGEIQIDNGYKIKLFEVCQECNGKRYKKEVLKYEIEKKNIWDILSMEVNEAIEFFKTRESKIYRKLIELEDVGLGYLKLNQDISTLSGGENQRIKLIKNIGLKKIIALDEPFQGLSNKEIENVIKLLYYYVKNGSTIIIVEHNPLVLSYCSYIIEFDCLKNRKTKLVFNGRIDMIYKSNNSLIKKYF